MHDDFVSGASPPRTEAHFATGPRGKPSHPRDNKVKHLMRKEFGRRKC